jgi:hypothetical protein
MEKILNTPLSNLQLELLKIFSHNLSEKEIKEVRTLLLDYFSKKAISEADQVWDIENWNDEKIQSILNDSERAKYGR